MEYIGSVAIGLVWGWLAVQLRFKKLVTILALVGAVVLLAVEVYWLAGLRAIPLFLLGLCTTSFLHSAWLHEMRT